MSLPYKYTNLLLCISILFFSLNILANNPVGIRFNYGTWEQVKKQAQKERKYIFVDAYASYCAPCVFMDQHVFTQPDVGTMYNRNFINYKLDIQTPEGRRLKEMFDIQVLPEILFFSPSGELIFRDTGDQSSQELIAKANQILDNKIPEVDRSDIIIVAPESGYGKPETQRDRMFRNGAKNPDFLYDYAHERKRFMSNYTEVADLYLKKQVRRFKSLRSARNMKFIYEFSEDPVSLAMKKLLKHRQWFDDQYGDLHIDTKIKNTLRIDVKLAARENNDTRFKQNLKVLKKTRMADRKAYAFELKALYYSNTQQWDKYAKSVNKYLHRTKRPDANFLQEAAEKIYENTTDPKLLKCTRKWMERSVKIENKYYNNHTYAKVLFATGKDKKAREVAKAAIRIAKRTHQNYSPTTKLLNKYNRGSYRVR